MFLQAPFLPWITKCKWLCVCGSRTTLSAKPQLDPPLFPIQNGDPCTVPPMLLMIGFLSLLFCICWRIMTHQVKKRLPYHWSLEITQCVLMYSTYENSLHELPFHFVTFKRVSFQSMSEKKNPDDFHSFILLLVVRVFLKGAVHTKLKFCNLLTLMYFSCNPYYPFKCSDESCGRHGCVANNTFDTSVLSSKIKDLGQNLIEQL